MDKSSAHQNTSYQEPQLGLLCWAAHWDSANNEGLAQVFVFVDLEAGGRIKAVQAAMPTLTERAIGAAAFATEEIAQAVFDATERVAAPREGQSEEEAGREKARKGNAVKGLREGWAQWRAMGIDEDGDPKGFELDELKEAVKEGQFKNGGNAQLLGWVCLAPNQYQDAQNLKDGENMARAASEKMREAAQAAFGPDAVLGVEVFCERAEDDPAETEARVAGMALAIVHRKALAAGLAAAKEGAALPSQPNSTAAAAREPAARKGARRF